MKLAIHNGTAGFHPGWITYCKQNNIPFKLVDCYETDIVQQLKGCNALMWHFSQSSSKDIVIAKCILFALEQSGFKVFPDFNTAWHFDDKVGQKYLLEALNLPLVPSYVFLEKESALQWIEETTFPKVWKLRGGAASANVKLVHSKTEAKKLLNRAFGTGFKQYDAWTNLKDRLIKYKEGKISYIDILKGIARFAVEPEFSKTIGKGRAYVYLQEFIPGNDSDIRVMVVDNKAFAYRRMVRKGDFRASGSGNFSFLNIDEELIRIALSCAKTLKAQSIAFDFIYDNLKPLIVEISYGFGTLDSDKWCGYWDENLIWHNEKFIPEAFMVESVLKQIEGV